MFLLLLSDELISLFGESTGCWDLSKNKSESLFTETVQAPYKAACDQWNIIFALIC